MPNALLRTALVAILLCLPLAALAAPKPFAGPSGWEHIVAVTPAAQVARAQETWKKTDGQVLTYLEDGGLAYEDILAMVKKNIADNSLRPAVDKDRTCDGRRAHEVEMTFGPTVVHQVIVDDAPGVTKLTYFRAQGSPAGADVTGALAAYCGGTS